jgi:hypothetical protein
LAAGILLALAGVGADAQDPHVLRLRAATFDPVRDGVPDLDGWVPSGPVLRPGVADRYRLVQFDGRVDGAVHARCRALGVDVIGYVPRGTLLVRLPEGATGERLDALVGRRWVGRVQPGYKLAPELRRAGDLAPSAEPVRIDAVLFAGEAPAPIVRALAERFPQAVVAFVDPEAVPSVTVAIPSGDAARLAGALARDPAVAFVAPRPPLEPLNDQAVWIGQSYDRVHGPVEAAEGDPKPYALAATVWARGLLGDGQIVAVADTGLEHAMCFFADPAHAVIPQSVAPPAPLALQLDHRKILAYNAPHPAALATDDSFRHGTHTAGSVAGDSLAHPAGPAAAGHDHGDGMAPLARIVFEDVSGSVNSSCSTSIAVDSIELLLQQEHAAGARVSSNSWGAGGGLFALEIDAAGWQLEDLLVVFSAGNNGAGGLTAPAACKNCVTVGAAENWDDAFRDVFGTLDPENMTAFSSRGPTADGRIKPDVVAPGFRVGSSRFPVEYVPDSEDPACEPGGPGVCAPGFGGCYVTDTAQTCHADLLLGTSMAAPIVAGLAALAREYFADGFHPGGFPAAADARTPSAALLKAVLVNGARGMAGHLYERRGVAIDFGPLEDAPSPVQGWGRAQLDDALHFSGDSRKLWLLDVPNAGGIAAGQSLRATLAVSDASEPLKLTLAWTDPPAQPVAELALVNDLDLRLTAPDGTIYRGNQWAAGEPVVDGGKLSQPDPPGKDAVNNVEGVLVALPPPGVWVVEVLGADVPGVPGELLQGAAVVATGAVGSCTSAAPPQGLRVVGATSQQVDLAWEAVPGALGYALYRNATGCGAPLAADHVVPLPAGATAYADADVAPSTVYHYTVRAVVDAGGCETEDAACVAAATPPPGPPPVPDGTFGSPLLARRQDATGSTVLLRWDVLTCPAPGYHVLYGPLDAVDALAPAGAVCVPGVTGSFVWEDVPGSDLWFLVVGHDGAVEGSWGAPSDGTPRGGGAPSLACGTTTRDEAGACP